MKGLLCLGLILNIASCSKGNVERHHHEAVMAGYDKLPIAKSLHDKFGGWSFIVHWNIPNDPKYGVEKDHKDWQTTTYIYDRYEMTYVQKVRLSANGGRVVEPVGGGILYILEISKIYGDPVASTTDYGDFQIKVEGEDLKKLAESDWDFESIGVDLKTKNLIDNIEWKRNYWNRIYPLQK